jgi:hypothetical protein
MRRVQSCVSGFLLLASATAWAGIEPYPEAVIGESASTRSRAEVVAELREAIRSGRMYDHPYMYADRQAFAQAGSQAGGETRAAAQVTVGPDGAVVVWGDTRAARVRIQAEAAEANRLGLLSFGEGDPPIATDEQEQLIAVAGRRAVESMRAADAIGQGAAGTQVATR